MTKALLVGINKYNKSHLNLNGCINDLWDFYILLNGVYGIKENDIYTLTDEMATFENISKCIYKVLRLANKNETVIIYYSGHGTQVPDLDGDELDGLDEVLCPHDFNWKKTFTDDILSSLIITNAKENSNIYLVFDCCHSGTLIRDIEGSPENDLIIQGRIESESTILLPPINNKQYKREKYIPPPIDAYIARRKSNIKNKSITIAKKESNEKNIKICTLSAAQDNQTAKELYLHAANKTRGAFTYSLTSMIREQGKNITIGKEIEHRINKKIKESVQNQEANIVCSPELMEKPIFS